MNAVIDRPSLRRRLRPYLSGFDLPLLAGLLLLVSVGCVVLFSALQGQAIPFSDQDIEKMSGQPPRQLRFRYAGSGDGLPAVPGAQPAPVVPTASAAESSSAPVRPVTPWPRPASGTTAAHAAPTAAEGRYAPPRCTPGPLFSRFGAQPDRCHDDEGERL